MSLSSTHTHPTQNGDKMGIRSLQWTLSLKKERRKTRRCTATQGPLQSEILPGTCHQWNRYSLKFKSHFRYQPLCQLFNAKYTFRPTSSDLKQQRLFMCSRFCHRARLGGDSSSLPHRVRAKLRQQGQWVLGWYCQHIWHHREGLAGLWAGWASPPTP